MILTQTENRKKDMDELKSQRKSLLESNVILGPFLKIEKSIVVKCLFVLRTKTLKEFFRLHIFFLSLRYAWATWKQTVLCYDPRVLLTSSLVDM